MRITSSVPIGVRHIQPLIGAYNTRFPEVEIDFNLADDLAELAGILARHADRMPAFLWKAGVVDDPGLDLPWTAGVTIAATLAMTVSSDQGDCPTK